MTVGSEKSFRGLLVWRQAMTLAATCYRVTKMLPREELYGLVSQIRRAAVSIPANIAEGTGRGTRKDFASFLRIAQGSLRELETYLLLLVEIRLLPPATTISPLMDQVASVGRLLHRLIRAMDPIHRRQAP